MKKNAFLRHRFLLILLVVLSCILLVTACNNDSGGPGGKGIASIALSNTEQPQSLYVEGQELNLSKGALVVVHENGLKENIALNTEGVTVTGYDKNTLGEQNLVVSYGGKSISLTVSVNKRMTFSGYETNYFVGDTIDVAKGKVVIVKDDGTKLDVRLSDSAISVVSFDSSTAGQGKLVTIRYSGDGVEYTDTIAVNVHDFGNIKFTKPTRTSYGSHDTELNLNGGYFSITAKDNDQVYKNVPLTQDMVSGFDPGAATRENIEDPIAQVITVSYGGNSYEFKISLLYSGVSIMLDAIEALKDVDLDAEKLKIEENDVYIAQEGMVAYLALSPGDRNLLDTAAVEKVARINAYSCNAYAEMLARQLHSAIIVEPSGVSLVEESTYESITEAYMYLTDPNCAIVAFSEFLEDFVEEFGDLVLKNEVVVAQYVRFVPAEGWSDVADILELMLDAYEALAVVPDAWSAESLADYGDAVEVAVTRLTTFSNDSVVSPVCNVISTWRANDDYLDIIYTYYVHYLPGMLIEETWGKLPLPPALEEIYTQIYLAVYFSSQLENMGAQSLWADTGYIFLYRYRALELAEKLLAGDNQLYKDLYVLIDFDDMIQRYIDYSSIGIVNLMSAGYADKEITALLEIYTELLVNAASNNGTLPVDENKQQLQALFEGFAALTPSKQNAFISSLCHEYGLERVLDRMVLSFSEDYEGNILTSMFQIYFGAYLPETMQSVAQDMLLSMEYYLNKDRYDDAMDNFMAKMDSITAAYASFSMQDKALFDRYLGAAFAKYNVLYNLEKNGQTVTQDQYIDLFNELVQSIRDYHKVRAELVDEETFQVNSAMLGMTIAAFERVDDLMNQIKALNSPEITALLALFEMESDDGTAMNLDFAYMNVRYNFIVVMHSVTFNVNHDDGTQERVYAWELYSDTNARDVMLRVYHVLMAQYAGTEMDAETVLAIMKEFRRMMTVDINSIYVFDLMGGDINYYEGLQIFFNGILSETNKAFAAKLLEVEKALCQYAYKKSDNAEALATVLDTMEELIGLHDTLTDTEEFDTYLGEMYDFYLNQYQLLKAEAEGEA